MVANFVQIDTILQFRVAQCFSTAHIQTWLGDNSTTTTYNREIESPLAREVQQGQGENVSSFYKVTVTCEVVIEDVSLLSEER